MILVWKKGLSQVGELCLHELRQLIELPCRADLGYSRNIKQAMLRFRCVKVSWKLLGKHLVHKLRRGLNDVHISVET